MSETEVRDIIHRFENKNYSLHLLEQFHNSEYKNVWSKEIILGKLQNAFSNRYGGIHFIPSIRRKASGGHSVTHI